MRRILSLTNVALRGVLEAGIVAALAVWGYTLAEGGLRFGLAVLVPVLGFGFWGAVDFRSTGRLAEPLRLGQELTVSVLAAAGLAAAGHDPLAWLLLLVSGVHHGTVYALGERLLKPRAAEPGRATVSP